MPGIFSAVFAGFGLAFFGIGLADHTRFNASLKGIAGASSCADRSEGFALDMDKYYLALGRFVDRYADVEDHMFVTLHRTAGLELKEGQALFSGTRVTGAMDFIRRLYEARGIPLPDRLDEVFAQLRAITKVRDHVLHSGTREFNNQLQSSNNLRSHRIEKIRTEMVSPEFMDDLTADLNTIIAALSAQMVMHEFAPGTTDPNHPNAHGLILAAHRPWRYTRP